MAHIDFACWRSMVDIQAHEFLPVRRLEFISNVLFVFPDDRVFQPALFFDDRFFFFCFATNLQ